jgi:Tfp pilus assembly protein PilO
MAKLKGQLDRLQRVQWALWGIVLAAAAAFYFAGYRPKTQRIADLRLQVESSRGKVESNQAKARSLRELAREVQRLEDKVHGYGRQMPRQPELGEFLGDITRVSQQLALRDWKYEPALPKRGDSYFELPITMHFVGEFANAASFLRQVEELQRLTRVRRLQIKARDRKAGQVEVDVAMNIYFSEGQ